MSPKQITRLGLIIGTISLIGAGPMLIFRPDFGLLTWWPGLGLVLAIGLFVVSFTRGAYLAAQRRVELVDMLNDCYQGNAKQGES